MSVCAPCLEAKQIPRCITTLVIGTLAISTAYYVYIRNVATDRIERFSATSNGAGLLSITLGEFKFQDEIEFEIWATLTTGDLNDRATITIGLDTTECISVKPISVKDSQSGAEIVFATVNLEA